jgi:hypothetical protein
MNSYETSGTSQLYAVDSQDIIIFIITAARTSDSDIYIVTCRGDSRRGFGL